MLKMFFFVFDIRKPEKIQNLPINLTTKIFLLKLKIRKKRLVDRFITGNVEVTDFD